MLMTQDIILQANERIDILYPDQFKIIQSKEVFSYSKDAILLAHFARVPSSSKAKILDLCAGNGAVTMAIASQTKAHVIGIEIQERLVDMAERSSQLNHLQDQVHYINMDIKDYKDYFKPSSIDMITCNPPYFNSDKSRQNPNPALALARHELTLNMDSLLKALSQLLKMNGTAFLVYSTGRFLELVTKCQEYNLTPKRIQMVYSKPGRESKFFLIELIKNGSPLGFKMLEPLYIMDENSEYSKEMSQILYGRN